MRRMFGTICNKTITRRGHNAQPKFHLILTTEGMA
jgi:hypothetical protein